MAVQGAQRKRFAFSAVIPIYNTEDYLEEAIQSIICQDIGFEDHIQLLLVDDGSTDSSFSIAQKYAEKYPKNIIAISQNNQGASSARRHGLHMASGKYVTFLDSDDKWSEDSFSEAFRFFQQHPDVVICAAPIRFFGAQDGDHPLSYRFHTTQVIDLNSTVDYPQLSLSDVFIRRDAMDDNLFDDRLQVSEDFVVVNRILLSSMKYGIVHKPTYWYRKRADNSSALDGSTMNESWYLDTPRYCYAALFDEAKRLYGQVPLFLQYTVMYDLQWRIKKRTPHPLSDNLYERYKSSILLLLSQMDDSVIAAQRNLNLRQKLYILGLKHGLSYEEAQQRLLCLQECVYFDAEQATFLADLPKLNRLILEKVEDLGGSVRFIARSDSILPPGKLKLRVQGKSFEKVIEGTVRYDRSAPSFFDAKYGCSTGFTFELPIENVSFDYLIDGRPLKVALYCGKNFPLSLKENGYLTLGSCLVLAMRNAKNKLGIRPRNQTFELKREILWERYVWENDKERRALLPLRRKALRMRRQNDGQKIWLIFDRTYLAGDNGEVLFEYLQQHPIAGVKPYFVINRDSVDYDRIAAIGPVVAFNSPEHKLLHLLADKIISSAADDYITNRFGDDRYVMHGVADYDFVFLQHGVIQNDMSSWLNWSSKGFDLFCTSARAERQSILETASYGYAGQNVVLTGLPRHDKLLRKAATTPTQKRVLIAPTWRQGITTASDPQTGLRAQSEGFVSSEYYRFFQQLINDQVLRAVASELGYEIDFLVHPALMQEAEHFTSDFCNVLTEYNYSELFVKSAILVTDWSSVAFDFALLKKPIVYAQYDAKTFYRSHAWGKGYFDYMRDGFGPVCETLEYAVEVLTDAMRNPSMPEEYAKRVDSFFGEQPADRCKAVIDAVLEFDKSKTR